MRSRAYVYSRLALSPLSHTLSRTVSLPLSLAPPAGSLLSLSRPFIRSTHAVHQAGKKWIVQCRLGGKVKHVGSFSDERVAAQAYDDFATANGCLDKRFNFKTVDPKAFGPRIELDGNGRPKRKRRKKDPDAPTRPRTGYNYFVLSNIKEMSNSLLGAAAPPSSPQRHRRATMRALGAKWSAMRGKHDLGKYEQLAKADQMRYQKEKKQWASSAAAATATAVATTAPAPRVLSALDPPPEPRPARKKRRGSGSGSSSSRTLRSGTSERLVAADF